MRRRMAVAGDALGESARETKARRETKFQPRVGAGGVPKDADVECEILVNCGTGVGLCRHAIFYPPAALTGRLSPVFALCYGGSVCFLANDSCQ